MLLVWNLPHSRVHSGTITVWRHGVLLSHEESGRAVTICPCPGEIGDKFVSGHGVRQRFHDLIAWRRVNMKSVASAGVQFHDKAGGGVIAVSRVESWR